MVGDIVKQLVLEGKRVIIPNFGAFLIRDAATVPLLTSDNVTFSQFLRYNDGFLEKELVQRASVHKDETNAVISAFVDEIIAAINTHGKYGINGLGYFYKDEKNGINFSISDPHKEEISHASTQNSEQVVEDIPTVQESQPLQNEEETAAAQSSSPVANERKETSIITGNEAEEDVRTKNVRKDKPIEKVSAEKKKVIATETIKESSDRAKAPRKHWTKVLIGGIAAIGVLLVLNVFWNDIFGIDNDSKKPKIILEPIEPSSQADDVDKAEKKVNKENKVQNEIDKQILSTLKEKSTPENTEKSKSETKTDKKKEKESVSEKKKIEQSKNSAKVEISNSYVIVLGSFGTEANAKKRLQELSAKNISAKIIERNNMHSIVFGNFSDYDKAQKEQTRLKGLGVEGWISRR